ncbi:3-ketoacyl-CoA thiolase [bacterium BMS3Abin05]|nr:3-ketoacyl-CoA thiolase [bacterium BMS3Abin05]HDZ10816.1 thiolase family protein [Bacteroidota bacterium]
MIEAVIVTGVRTAVGKAKKGALKNFRPDEMAAAVIRAALDRTPGLKPEEIDDVLIGCAFPEAEQGMNVARVALFRAGIPVSVPGATINRFCSSGLQTIAFAAEHIMAGFADVIFAGGTESMSLVPMIGSKFRPNPYLSDRWPGAFLAMGLTAERVAEQYHVSREEQDEFSLQSHMKAVKAVKEGKFKDEIVPLKFEERRVGPNGKIVKKEIVFDTDEGPRADTSLEKLGRLRPAFKVNGTVTAGNSSQMSDAAAMVVVMSKKKADELGLKPLARFVGFAAGGVDPEIMGMGPTAAIPKVLEKTGLMLSDMDLIELNEAFASQSLAVTKQLGLDREKLNVNGGAIALGHPLGCTGTKLTVHILNEMKRRKARYGMVTMCIGGGMGAAGIFERL